MIETQIDIKLSCTSSSFSSPHSLFPWNADQRASWTCPTGLQLLTETDSERRRAGRERIWKKRGVENVRKGGGEHTARRWCHQCWLDCEGKVMLWSKIVDGWSSRLEERILLHPQSPHGCFSVVIISVIFQNDAIKVNYFQQKKYLTF